MSASKPTTLQIKQAYSVNAYMSYVPRRTKWSRALNVPDGFSFSSKGGVTRLPYDNPYSGIGTHTDVEQDMELVIYHQNTSTEKARLRVAYGAADADSVEVEEFSRGTADPRDNDRIEAVEYWPYKGKMWSNTEAFLPDSREPFNDQTRYFLPIVNGGGPLPGIVNKNGIARYNFSADTTFMVGGGDFEVLWDFGDGTPFVGDLDDINATVDFTADEWFRHVKLTGTSVESGRSFTKKIPVWSFSEDNPPMPVEITRFNANLDDGWSFGVRVHRSLDMALLPDRSLIVIWGRHYYGGQRAGANAFGGFGTEIESRDHVLFVGYLDSTTIRISADGDTLEFKCISPVQAATNVRAYPTYVEDENDPDNYQEMTDLTLNKMLWFNMQYQSSIFNYHDFLWLTDHEGDGNTVYPSLQVANAANITNLLRGLAKSWASRMTTDRLGRWLVRRDLTIASQDERDDRQIYWDFTMADWAEVSWEQEHTDSTGLVRGGMFDFDGDPHLAEAPGAAPGQGPGFTDVTDLVGFSGAYLRQVTADIYASQNGTFWDETTGVIKKVPQGLSMKVRGAFNFIDPCLMNFVTLTLPATANKRGVEFDQSRFMPRSISGSFDKRGRLSLTFTLDHETHGPPAEFRKVPDPPQSDWKPPLGPGAWELDPVQTVPEILPPPYGYTTTGIQANRVLVLGTDGPYCARAFSEDGFLNIDLSTYEDISSGLTGQCILAHVDPWDFDTFYIITTEGLFRGKPIEPTFAGWTLVASNDDIWGDPSFFAVEIRLSINREGWLMLRSGDATATTANCRAGTPTWTVIGIDGGVAGGDPALLGWGVGGMFPCLNNGGTTGWVFVTTGAWPTFKVWRNVNWGLSGSWVEYATMGGTVGSDVAVPYKRFSGALNTPTAALEILYGAGVSNTGQDSLVRTGYGDIGSTVVDRWLRFGWPTRRGLVVSDENPLLVYTGVLGQPGGGGTYTLGISATQDGITFEDWTVPAFSWFSPGNLYPAYGITLNPQNKNWAMMYMGGYGKDTGVTAGQIWNYNAGGLAVTVDKGETWVDLMTGTNLATILNSTRVSYAQIF